MATTTNITSTQSAAEKPLATLKGVAPKTTSTPIPSTAEKPSFVPRTTTTPTATTPAATTTPTSSTTSTSSNLYYSGQKDANGNPIYAKAGSTQGYDAKGNPVSTSPIVSPERPIGGTTPTTPVKPAASSAPVNNTQQVTNTTDQINQNVQNIDLDSQKILNEQKALTESQIGVEGEYKDTLIQLANERYAQEQENLAAMQQLANDALANRNAALEQSANVQKKDAEIAMQFADAQAKLQRERTAKAYQDQIIEQKSANTRRILDQESKIASAGGFGNFTTNQLIANTTVDNDKLLNNLVFQKDISDKEVSAQLDNIHKEYTQNLTNIEVQKQTAIQKNYDSYLQYVQQIQADREMSQQAKSEAIANAALNYKKNVQQINSSSFQQRYEISTQLADRAKEQMNDQKNDARAVIKSLASDFMLGYDDLTPAMIKDITALESKAGFPAGSVLANLKALKEKAKAENLEIQEQIDDNGNVTYIALDKKTGKVVNQETLEGIAKITQEKGTWSYQTDDFGNVYAFDATTGTTKPISSIGGNFGFIQSGGGSQGTPNWTTSAGMAAVGDMQIPQDKFNEIFKIGKKYPLFNADGSLGLGQCGVFASACSTAGPVGNSWGEKKTRINKSDDFSLGDKLLMPMKDASGKVTSGHVALVVSYNKGTGDIGVVESNADGKGTVRQHVYNVNKLNQLYGKGAWGAMGGSLEPDVMADIKGAGAIPLKTAPGATQPNTPAGENTVQGIMAKYGVGVKKAEEMLAKQFENGLPGNAATKTDKAIPTGNGFSQNIGGVETNPYKYSVEQAHAASPVEKKIAGQVGTAMRAEGQIATYEKAGIKTSEINTAIANISPDIFYQPGSINAVISQIKSPREKDLLAARLQWIESVLRSASGAAISASEYQSYAMQYFPNSGASQAEIDNFAAARRSKMKSLINEAGPAAALINPELNFSIAPDTGSPASNSVNETINNAYGAVTSLGNSAWQGLQSLAGQSGLSKTDQSDIDNIFN